MAQEEWSLMRYWTTLVLRQCYINSDVAAELGLQGQNRRMTVNALNSQTDGFETMPFELYLESLDRIINVKIAALQETRE